MCSSDLITFHKLPFNAKSLNFLSVFQLINHLFNILDTMMASHVSAIAVSAVAYLSQLQNMISAVGTGLAVGSSLKISEAYGAGDYDMVKKRLSTLITICGICSAVVLCILPSGNLVVFVNLEDIFAELEALLAQNAHTLLQPFEAKLYRQ